jgi:hypothetical protein
MDSFWLVMGGAVLLGVIACFVAANFGNGKDQA